MAFAPDPAKERAAQEAEAEARAAIDRRLEAEATKRMNPFERRLLGVLEDLRDAIAAPEPVLAVCEPNTPSSVLKAIQSALPPGSLVTGPNGPIISAYRIAPAATAAQPPKPPPLSLDALLDAPAPQLVAAIKAGGEAIVERYPHFRHTDGKTPLDIAQAAIEGALRFAAAMTSDGPATAAGGAAGGDPLPPADHPHP
ncbi:hypothetical protein LV457_02675 [Mycobacterium sp. MYCO198283]|uniref:hypothetical protein n=1 Tax=Mycobacterium sp. MYCO198283 TaxID=2883505 RepID=UPI001E4F5AF6|nr:hypothetical protein [Mycobacterium sp. MYCO198283]MCG5431194.1 hypothetical protein [Mycobacterium sp. MYCO198283]